MDLRLVLVLGVLVFGIGWAGPDGRAGSLMMFIGGAFALAAVVDLLRGRTQV